MKLNLNFNRTPEFILVTTIYAIISIVFLFGLIISSGDVAQGDWGIPLTSSAAINDFSSHLFVRSYNGFGVSIFDRSSFPYLQTLNAILAPVGFVGGTEIKILSIFLVSLCGINAFFLARYSFRLSKLSSFLSGLFFMTTPVVFNWLIFGWIYYLIAYALLPLMILVSKRFMETNDLRFALLSGLILSVATIQPTFVLIYPLLIFTFILFESRSKLKYLKRGLTIAVTSLSIWFLTNLSFFTSYNNAETLSFYFTDYLDGITSQFANFSSLINPIRLWGSTFNYQFETYFPQTLIIVSFIPIVLAILAVLLKSNDRRVLYFSSCYLLVSMAYLVSNNMAYLVTNLPYGAIFESPSIFLVPASVGLAMLIGYVNEFLPVFLAKFRKVFSLHSIKKLSFVIILILIVLTGLPWWTGQISGSPIRGPPTKLNLYEIPSDYTRWSNGLNVSNEYFILYLPLQPNVQLADSDYFSYEYEGISNGIFTRVNNFPCVSDRNSSLFLNALMNGTPGVGELFGDCSIKYVVVYTNVLSPYNMSDILSALSEETGMTKVVTSPNVIVFEDEYAKPVVYSNKDTANVRIVHIDPTLFRIQANSNAPFTLTLNQFYSSGWSVWVNGSVLPDSAHFKDVNGFNEWKIDSTGNMAIEIYYEPQTLFLISKIITSVTLVVVTLYIVLVSFKKSRDKPKE